MQFTVNGQTHTLPLDHPAPRSSICCATNLNLTRHQERLQTRGACGACTVLVDGERINACLALAVQVQGRAITTIEGLGHRGAPLHPLQQAFLDHDGLQCGYCTPGQICSAIALQDEARTRRTKRGHAGSCGGHDHT